MEDVGAQFAPPIFIHHQTHPFVFHEGTRKRDLSYHAPNLQSDNWNPKAWEWDSMRFVARPMDAPQVLQLSTPSAVGKKVDGGSGSGSSTVKDDSLRLNLGGGLNSVEEPVSRPNKKVRSGSPGSNNYPKCQVDDCKEDLSSAKDYHRRHKVCEVHSKSGKALVGNQLQRFCQQCSRFHPLTEFDEGKRSCRRRLAGHNRRRRKTQPEDVMQRVVLTGDQSSSNNGNLDVANLLKALARFQGNNEDNNNVNSSSVTERDQLIKILSKINSIPLPMDLAAKLSSAGVLNNKNSGQSCSGNQNRSSAVSTSSSTMDLLAVLSATLAASAPDALAILSQRISQGCNSEKSKVSSANQVTTPEKPMVPSEFPSTGGERSSRCYQPTNDDSDCQIQETRQSLPLQLFGSPEAYSPPKFSSSRKYYSSDSSNPIEDMSPSSSPPVVQKLFPLQSMADTVKSEKISLNRDVNNTVEGSRSRIGTMPLELFRESNRAVDRGSPQNLTYRGGYTSSSGSDHSSPSQNSDSQERTERIIVKLFDKDPSHFPGTLRTQIYNWLSNSPSDMESYIRPGCVVLSVYLSIQSAVMEQFERNLLQHVDSLLQDEDSEFWRSGRFLLRVGRQLVSHNDGKIRICKSWKACTSPELISVTPLAVVCGQETSLLLRGRNLTNPGTRIHCTYMGDYISREHNELTYPGTTYDEINVKGFKVLGESPKVLGRCFIEVENGFKGNSLPVIIADATICDELRLLESELDEGDKVCNIVPEEQTVNLMHSRSREDVLHFLNELGWLFQKKRLSSVIETPDYSLNRFKFLLIFTTERDCCVLVKTILDMLVERHLNEDGLSQESVDMLSDVHLLNRAVKRRFRKMVDLLIHYSIPTVTDGIPSRMYIFPPNLLGPGGITPLHLAACTLGSEEMVDALTNDPQGIGLSCWNSTVDANGQSPYAYALTTRNESYNRLVAGKLGDRRNGQVTLTIANEIKEQSEVGKFQKRHGCTKCAVVAARYNTRIQRTQGLLQRPYIHSMLAIAAVCVCVCLFFRGAPDIGSVAPFKWENLEYGVL